MTGVLDKAVARGDELKQIEADVHSFAEDDYEIESFSVADSDALVISLRDVRDDSTVLDAIAAKHGYTRVHSDDSTSYHYRRPRA